MNCATGPAVVEDKILASIYLEVLSQMIIR